MSRTDKTSGRTVRSDLSAEGQTRARREAVEAALVEGQNRLLWFLVGRVGNIDDANDILQDFAVHAIRRSGDLRDVASVRGWLGRLLATSIANHHRRSTRRRRSEVPEDPWGEDAGIAAQPDTETDAAICGCLGEVIGLLPAAYAELLRRIDLQDQPRAEVARFFNISEGNLAVRLHRARSKLRDRLVEMCLTCPEHGFLDCACDRARARTRAAEHSAADTPV